MSVTGQELGGPIFLIGMPSSGKTRVGKELASQLGVEFFDTDAVIEQAVGMTIKDFFAAHGEAEFRQREAQTVAGFCRRATPAVVSLGGGAIETPSTREHLRGRCVVYLRVDRDQCVANLTGDTKRPMFATGNVEDKVDELLARRLPLYRQLATITHDANERNAVGHAQAIVRRLSIDPIHVSGDESYDVVFGWDLAGRVAGFVDEGARVLIMHPEALTYYATAVKNALTDKSPAVTCFVTPDAEAQKTVASCEQAWEACADAHLGRDDVIIGIGGGATTDFAGFIAATWLRGIRFISVPTSVLAMVDAGIGGKTGINTPAGKNLVGAFYPPAAVLADFSVLTTLKPHMVVEGLGEVIKCGFIASQMIIDTVSNNDACELSDISSQAFQSIVMEGARVKAEVVSTDLKESGQRENLNYGHTFAHALEKAFDYTVPHGQAVAVGMVFAARLAVALGELSPEEAALHEELEEKLHLHTRWRGASWQALLAAMAMDKKVRRGALRFVVLAGQGNPHRVQVDDIDLLRDIAMSLCREAAGDGPAGNDSGDGPAGNDSGPALEYGVCDVNE